jgi:hypothetical protein
MSMLTMYIDRIQDHVIASRTAREIALWTGQTPDRILTALEARPISIRSETLPHIAFDFRQRLRALGAGVRVAVTGADRSDDEDDEPGAPVRRLLQEEIT